MINKINTETIEAEEVEILEDVQESEDINADESILSPMHEPRKDREYAQGDTNNFVGDIPEPSFTPEYVPDEEIIEGGEKHFASEKTKTKQDNEIGENNELTEAEKQEAAACAAEELIDSYVQYTPMLFKYISRFPEKKLKKLVLEGKVDENLQLNVDGQVCTLNERVTKYNAEIETAFDVEPEFKEKLMPPLTRVFAKAGVGLSDGQFIAIEVGKDLVQKGFLVYQLRQQNAEMLLAMQDYTTQIRLHEERKVSEIGQTMPQESKENIPKNDVQPKANKHAVNIEQQVDDYEIDLKPTMEVNKSLAVAEDVDAIADEGDIKVNM